MGWGFFLTSLTLIFAPSVKKYAIHVLGKPDWRVWLLWVVSCYGLGTFDNHLYLRIYAFKSLSITAFIIWLPLLLHTLRNSEYNLRVGAIFILIFWMSWNIQGSYFPPFFEGISGWTRDVPVKEPSVSDYKIVRDDGKKKWISYDLFGPSRSLYYLDKYAQFKAFIQAHKLAKQDSSNAQAHFQDIKQTIRKKQLKYIYLHYVYHWPRLKEGVFPNNRYLGDWALPSPSINTLPDYSSFPPDRIAEIQYVNVKYDPSSGTKVHETILDRYKVK